jgi:hypothetical protein
MHQKPRNRTVSWAANAEAPEHVMLRTLRLILIKVWRGGSGDSSRIAPLAGHLFEAGRAASGIAVPEGEVNGAKSFSLMLDHPAFMR